MQLNEIQPPGGRLIDGYGPGGFRVDGVWHEGSVILSPDGVEGFEAPVEPGDLGSVLAHAGALDLVIVGQGEVFAPLPAPVRRALEEAGLGVETMATDAACRTYNLLLAENRRVAAIMVAI